MVTPVGIARSPLFLTARTYAEGCLDGLTTGQLVSPEGMGQDRGREGDKFTNIQEMVDEWFSVARLKCVCVCLEMNFK